MVIKDKVSKKLFLSVQTKAKEQSEFLQVYFTWDNT